MALQRSPSAGFGFEPNKNVEWMEDRYFFVYYAILILIARGITEIIFLCLPFASDKYAWSVVHIAHTVVSFVLLHWVKGTPYQLAEDQGRYDQDTFWEQIDHGRQGTFTRRMLTTAPVIIFLIASYVNHWDTPATIVNVVFLLVAVVPKFDAMDHVRIGGINED